MVDLSFTGLEPNVGPFQAQRGDISRRSELAPAETLQVFIEAGASEIVIGDILLSTAKASLQHPNWVVGGDGNAVAFKLRRTDIGKRIPRIAGLGRRWSTAVPMLELCRGESCRLHLACLGDSNTQSDYMTAFGVVSWCELLSGRRFAPTLATYNYAVPGGTLVSSKMVDANDQFDAMISVGDLPDVAVAAFGSNDIIFFGVSPTKLVDAYLALRLRAEQLGIRLLVGLTPYLYGERAVHNATIVELNALIAATFPPEEIADFFIVDHNCFFDDVHMNNLGQQVRCDAVLEALF